MTKYNHVCLSTCICIIYIIVHKLYCMIHLTPTRSTSFTYINILFIPMHSRYIADENIVRKGEIACNKQFLLFSQCFLPYMAHIFHLKCTFKCCLQSVSIWTSLKFCCLVIGYCHFNYLFHNTQLFTILKWKAYLFTKQQNFGSNQIESICRQKFKSVLGRNHYWKRRKG